jgi:hypothetical protein
MAKPSHFPDVFVGEVFLIGSGEDEWFTILTVVLLCFSCCCCLQTRPPPNSRVATVAYGDVVFVKLRQVNNNFQLGPYFGPLSLRNRPSGSLRRPACPAGQKAGPQAAPYTRLSAKWRGGTGAKSSAGSAMIYSLTRCTVEKLRRSDMSSWSVQRGGGGAKPPHSCRSSGAYCGHRRSLT